MLALGVLTMPVLVRSPLQRRHHRAVHYAQAPVRQGRVCLNYVISDAELKSRTIVERDAVLDENRTFGDLLLVPAVPRGPLRHLLYKYPQLTPTAGAPTKSQLQLIQSVPPAGAGCVYKILSWLQHISHVAPSVPFVAYTDDDTFWGLTRVVQTLSLLRPAEAHRNRIYAGAMQYHSWYDFRQMNIRGWHFTLPGAVHMFTSSREGFDPRNTTHMLPPGASQAQFDMAARHFFKPYPMAHGLGVLLSQGLSRQMATSPAVVAFMELYHVWLESPLGAPVAKAEREAPTAPRKCRLGTDSTFGAWLRAHASWTADGGRDTSGGRGGSADPRNRTASTASSAVAIANDGPIIGVDLLNFNMNWPWPLPNRCHGEHANQELNDLHAFHLYGKVAANPSFWEHLHRHVTLVHERGGGEQRGPADAAMEVATARPNGDDELLAMVAKATGRDAPVASPPPPPGAAPPPRLYCKHGEDCPEMPGSASTPPRQARDDAPQTMAASLPAVLWLIPVAAVSRG